MQSTIGGKMKFNVDKIRDDIINRNTGLYHPIPDATRERPYKGHDVLITRKSTEHHYDIRHSCEKGYAIKSINFFFL